MKSRHRSSLFLALTLALVTLVAGCQQGIARPRAATTTSAIPYPAASGDFAATVELAHSDGLGVWIEADLVKRWLQGASSFQAALYQIGALARLPGVKGIKIADEMAYHDGLTSVAQVRAFLSAAKSGLGKYAPGKPLLVDMVLPEMGCLPNHEPPLRWSTICQVRARGQYPALTLDAVDGYLHMGAIGVLDLSTDLLPDATYLGWGVDRNIAQNDAWAVAVGRGWDRLTQLQGRKALAHPGTYTESMAQTEADLKTFVDLPMQHGAQAIDIWTWRQRYKGDIYRLADPGAKPNALWQALQARRAAGAHLVTHISPHSVETDLQADLKMISTVFTDVFVAAGTG